jgi:hypothetical protein
MLLATVILTARRSRDGYANYSKSRSFRLRIGSNKFSPYLAPPVERSFRFDPRSFCHEP